MPIPDSPIVKDERLERIRRFAYWLDSGIELPATRVRIGLDPIIGLVPVLGDALGAVLAAWLFVEGVRRGVSRATLARIAYNIAADALIGTVPVLGDFFDFVWKANLRTWRFLSATGPIPSERTELIGSLWWC